MLKPASFFPAAPQCGTDPSKYHAFGSDFKRGEANYVMSRSELKKFAQCPRRWLIGTAEESSDAMEWGSLMDCVVLTPNRVAEIYAVEPATYPAKGKKKDDPEIQKPWTYQADHCKTWRADRRAEGKEPVKSEGKESLSEAWKAAKRLIDDSHIDLFLQVSKRQVWINVEWADEETGIVVPIKCLLDLVPDPSSEFGDTLGDLKTTCNASYRAWCKQVYNEGWHTQASLYLDAYNVASGLKYRNFEHQISENFAPYEPTHRMLSSEFLLLGRVEYQRQLKSYCQCLKTGIFQGYDCSIAEPDQYMIAA